VKYVVPKLYELAKLPMRRPVFWRAEQLHVLPSPPHRLGKCCGNHEMQRALVNKGRYQVHLCQLTLSECQDVSSIDQIEDPTGAVDFNTSIQQCRLTVRGIKRSGGQFV